MEIKHSIKVGDRVKVITHEGRVYNSCSSLPEFYGEIGTVAHLYQSPYAEVKFDCYDYGHAVEISCNCLKKIDRTFDEIIEDLEQNPAMEDFVRGNKHTPYEVCFRHKDCADALLNCIMIKRTGEVGLSELFTPEQITAISGACTEIAENYRMENKKNN